MSRDVVERASGAWSLGASLLLALLPKCPMCLVVYVGLGAGIGLDAALLEWAWPVSLGAFSLGLGFLYVVASRRRRWGWLALAFLGAVALAVTRATELAPVWLWLAFATFAVGTFGVTYRRARWAAATESAR